MSDFLDTLADLLEAKGIDRVFVGKQPPSPDKCITLLGLPGTTLTDSRDVKEMQFPRYQLLARAKTYSEASALFQQARNVLHGIIGLDIDDIRIKRNHVEQEGGSLGEDDKGRSEFSCNFIAQYHVIEQS